jgi:hypothetical protein
MKYDLICDVCDDKASVGILFSKPGLRGEFIAFGEVTADSVAVVDGGCDNRRRTALN